MIQFELSIKFSYERRLCMIDNKLQTLIQVAETGSYTKAALALSLSQPAVSQHIKQLGERAKNPAF